MSRSPLSPPVEVNPEVDEIHDRVRGHDQSHAVVPEMSGGEEDFFFLKKERKKKKEEGIFTEICQFVARRFPEVSVDFIISSATCNKNRRGDEKKKRKRKKKELTSRTRI